MTTRRVRAGDPSRAVAYLRVSTEDQRLGPEAQRAEIERWAARNHVTVLAWCADEGVSGGNELDARPALLGALAQIRAHGAGVLAVAKRDRIARDVVVAAAIDRAVRACGARVVSVDGVGNGDSPTEEFMRTILDGAAAYERALIRQRTRAALAVKIARGERVGGRVRYGYDEDAQGKLVENAGEQAVIARVRVLRSEGRSLRGIVAQLGEEGVRSRAGTPLMLRQVQVILSRATSTTATSPSA